MDKSCKVVGIACMWAFYIMYLELVGAIWNPGIYLEAAVHVRTWPLTGRRLC